MGIFWLRVALSFVVGGIWLMLISVIAEKSRHKLAALLGGLPSTVLISLFFIGLNQGTKYAAHATIVTPVVFIIDAYFVLLLIYFARKNYLTGLLVSSVFWFIATWLVVLSKLTSYPISLTIWVLGMAVLIAILRKGSKAKKTEKLAVQFSHTQLVLRSLFAGAVIAFAVLISHYSGPIIGGIFTAFPAAYISTFTILYFARGLNFAESFTRLLIVSGCINTVIYSIAVYYLYPRFGIYTGTLLAFAASLASSFFIVSYVLDYITGRY
jgi:uncharacterized membrane protein (GlpM family)